MYSENKNLNLLSVNPVGINDAHEEVEKFALKMNLQILKIGFKAEKKINKPFYKSFYKQLGIPYRYSYSYFYIPDNFNLEDKIFNHLLSYFGIKDEKFGVFHNEASDNIFDLDINSNLPLVNLSQKYDLFNNIFLYKKILYEADEIHCINSSFSHFIDRVNTKGVLYYHDVRGSRLKFKKKWKNIKYEN